MHSPTRKSARRALSVAARVVIVIKKTIPLRSSADLKDGSARSP
jgi:hypothetical protein